MRRPLGVLLLVGFALACVVALGWALPRTSVVERSDEIAATPATVYELLTDLRVERRWSPWRDAHARYLFSGPAFGVGSAMEWSGGASGRARVDRAQPYSVVEQSLTLRGVARRSRFTLTRSAQGTLVTWRMERDADGNPLARWRGLISKDLIGPELERGLDRLEEVAEALPHADLAGANVRLAASPEGRLVYVEGSAPRTPEGVGAALASARARVAADLGRAGVQASAGPIWIALPGRDPQSLSYRAGFVVPEAAASRLSTLRSEPLAGGPAVVADHRGGYAELGQAEAAARLFQAIHQLPSAGPTMVEFLGGEPLQDHPSVRLIRPVGAGP